MIAISDLTQEDIGRWVLYYPRTAAERKLLHNAETPQVGKLKGYNPIYVFVVYKCDNKWDNFTDYTSQATRPEDLSFIGD